MSSLIRSEIVKLRTARSFIVLICIAVGLTVLISTLSAFLTKFADPGATPPAIDATLNASFVLFFALILGVLSVTTEYRHGSIASTLLVEPDRPRLLAAKLIAASAVGAAIGLLVEVLSLGIEAAILPTRDLSLHLGFGELLKLLAGMAAAGALLTALGVGVGALIRRQTAAIVGVLVYLFVIETILTGVVLNSSLVRFTLNSAIAEVTATSEQAGIDKLDEPLGQIAGGLVLLAWAVVFALIGGAVMRNTDVTD
jgi:ABC-type transport system involved in multi-copper enzyme maturation permease subunit